MFLRMIAHPFYQYTLHSPSVYVLPVFEVAEDVPVPVDKAHLLEDLQSGDAIKFHEKICSNCHTVPGYVEWLAVVKDDYTMDIHVTARREGAYASWEPIYVGTKHEPEYDERLSWEGKADKMTQVGSLIIYTLKKLYLIPVFYFPFLGLYYVHSGLRLSCAG